MPKALAMPKVFSYIRMDDFNKKKFQRCANFGKGPVKQREKAGNGVWGLFHGEIGDGAILKHIMVAFHLFGINKVIKVLIYIYCGEGRAVFKHVICVVQGELGGKMADIQLLEAMAILEHGCHGADMQGVKVIELYCSQVLTPVEHVWHLPHAGGVKIT